MQLHYSRQADDALAQTAAEINTGIEDLHGDVAHLSIFSFPTMSNGKRDGIDAIFSLGSILAIREPTYIMMIDGPGAMIEVDTPSDVIFIEESSPLIQDTPWPIASSGVEFPILPSSMSGWKARGADEFQASRWLSAADCFTRALNYEPESQVLLLNRAETYLRLGWFRSALYDVEQAKRSGAFSDTVLEQKALVRGMKANYGLQRYARVAELAKTFPADATCTEWFMKATQRMKEENTGEFDWCMLFKETQRDRARPDVADYRGPVEVRTPSNGTGIRGMFTTRDVKAGELLVSARFTAF